MVGSLSSADLASILRWPSSRRGRQPCPRCRQSGCGCARGRAATADETFAEWRQRLEHQSDPARGLGYWEGYQAGVFIGWWSASSFAGRPEVSGIGYRLRVSGWGRGLATEGARAMVGQAFACEEVERVVASTMVANAASRRVLEKLGMRSTGSCGAGEGYELTRAEWEAGAHSQRRTRLV